MPKTNQNLTNIAQISKKDSQTIIPTILGSLKKPLKRLLFKVKNITLLPESKKPSFGRLGFLDTLRKFGYLCNVSHCVNFCNPMGTL